MSELPQDFGEETSPSVENSLIFYNNTPFPSSNIPNIHSPLPRHGGTKLEERSIGVPRQVFYALYQSFSQLNIKLASRADISITSESDDSGHYLSYQDTSRSSLSGSALPPSLDHSDSCDDLQGARKTSEGTIAVTVDRCCVCSTITTEEESMTTPCCFRAVGSICFEEALQETGKCCLCQVHQSRPSSRISRSLSDSTSEYKVHFATERYHNESQEKRKPEVDKGNASDATIFFAGNAVADGPPCPQEALVVNVTKDKETDVLDLSGPFTNIQTMRTVGERRKYSLEELQKYSRGFIFHTPLPKDLVPFLSRYTAKQHSRELAKTARGRTCGRRAQFAPIMGIDSLGIASWRTYAWANLEKRTFEPGDHLRL